MERTGDRLMGSHGPSAQQQQQQQRQEERERARSGAEQQERERRGSAQQQPPSRKSSHREAEARWRIPQSRYEVRQVIGTGSYGSVCEAYDRERQELVAVKRVRHMFDDLVDCKRILREVAILSRLRHDYVVQIYDVTTPGQPHSFDELYIIMEICDSDLKKLCRTDVTLTPLHINTLLYNLLVGVKYLHTAGIYHRDLKPANCLVNQDCSVKICDFGLARAIGGESSPMTEYPLLSTVEFNKPLTESREPAPEPSPIVAPGSGWDRRGGTCPKRSLTGHVVTRWYRAPELILLQENYTTAIDLWSVGCIYAELLGMLEGTKLEDRGPLFPGSSCFPLSPDGKHRTDYKYHSRGKHDQLSMIFNLLGSPSEADIVKVDRPDARRYLMCFYARQGQGLRNRFPHVEENSIDITRRLLVFSPDDRLDAQGALEHPLFRDIRDPRKEVSARGQVCLEFEKEPDLDENLLRRYFLREMQRFRGEDQEHLRRGGA